MNLSTFEGCITFAKEQERFRLSPEGVRKHKRDTAILIYSVYNKIKYSEARKLFDDKRW